MPTLNEMTLADFRALSPFNMQDAHKVTGVVLLPAGDDEEPHDSGYRVMDFVPCDRNTPLGRIGAYSDVLHIDGIGGFGFNWLQKYGTVPRAVPPHGWSIDCLHGSGLLRLFPSTDMCAGILLDPMALSSSFEIYGRTRPKFEVSGVR